MTLSKRRRAAAAVTAAMILLASCASVDGPGDTGDGPGDTSDDAATQENATEQLVAECSPPPDLPEAPPTFDQEDVPSGTDLSTVTATLTTNCGDIVLELYGDRAPVTVDSFIGLGEAGYWDGSPCHRLTTSGIFVLQCGDPTGTGRGGPGYTFGIENAPEDGQYPRGTVAMARAQDPNSNGGQYFIVYGDTALPTEGGGYTIFGTVVEGMDIVDQIAAEGTREGSPDGSPAQGISVLSVEITEEEATESD